MKVVVDVSDYENMKDLIHEHGWGDMPDYT